MPIQVKQFDEHKAKAALKECPKIVRDYVKLLEGHLKSQQELTGKAIGRLRTYKPGFLSFIQSTELSQSDKDLIKGVFYGYLKSTQPPSDGQE